MAPEYGNFPGYGNFLGYGRPGIKTCINSCRNPGCGKFPGYGKFLGYGDYSQCGYCSVYGS